MDIGDPRIDGRHIVIPENILPRFPTEEQKTLYYKFCQTIRSLLFPTSYRLQAPPGLEGIPEEETTDNTIIEDETREEHPSLRPEQVGRPFPIPWAWEQGQNLPSNLAPAERESRLQAIAENNENSSTYRKYIQNMAGTYLAGHPGPDGRLPGGSVLSWAHDCISGKMKSSLAYYHLFIALTYRKALCKLADRYVVLVATAPGGVLCANWDIAGADSLGDKFSWFNRIWRRIYTMDLFPPPSPSGEQGSTWTKPAKYLAASLIFAKNDEAQVDEKLDWLFAGTSVLFNPLGPNTSFDVVNMLMSSLFSFLVKTKALDGVCRGFISQEPSIANQRDELGAILGRTLRDPWPEMHSPSGSSA